MNLRDGAIDVMSRSLSSETTSAGDRVHARRDAEKLRYHRVVAERMGMDPDSVLRLAEENLRRWLRTDGDGKPYYQEWQRILQELSPYELVELITADTAEGRRLRQSSPFVGVLSRTERDALMSAR
jgi:hypothetical protein